jgi:2-keto-4-pentenoate hydratase/2-oxohepta-3-ene-1,7-dioic acid hydratase in catechol pathway
MKIAPLDEALTFARSGGALLAVSTIENGKVLAADMTTLAQAGEDAIDLLNRLGYDNLRSHAESTGPKVEIDETTLRLPVDLASAHIAVGTNYREHARESSVKGGPFLFPKLVAPTDWRATVPCGTALLDFEVELCLVTTKPLGLDDIADGGLILGNDFTDRATLLQHIDPANPQSGKGFTSGKSGPGWLPVGNLFVVPRDLNTFVKRLTLQLSVNGIERQRAAATEWIWDFDEILRQSRRQRTATWDWTEGVARLPFGSDGAIPARTLIMAGTPAGTIWQGPRASDFAKGVFDLFASAFTKPILRCVIDQYIARARHENLYLKAGDIVTISVDKMGAMANTVA